MLKSTPFYFFKIGTIHAFIASYTHPKLILAGASIGLWKLHYMLYQLDSKTRAILIPTHRDGWCFYDQTTATGEIDIDSILERAEAEHTRYWTEGRIPVACKGKQIRFSVGEYVEPANPYPKNRYTFYEAKIPVAGTNRHPYRLVAFAKWDMRGDVYWKHEHPVVFGLELPKDEIGLVAWLCCRDDRPQAHDKELVVYEDGSSELVYNAHVRLSFEPNTFTISEGQRWRFQTP